MASVLEESLDIMHWALGQNDPENWLADVDADLIAANDGPFKAALDRYKYPHRYDLPDGLAHRDEALGHLNAIGCSADRRSVSWAEASAVLPTSRSFRSSANLQQPTKRGSMRNPCPPCNAGLAAMIQSELFASIMARYPQWKAGDAPTTFP